jgi:dephospho-CoA kinase
VARVGLFGLMGSGKSTVARWFREWGATVVDGDALGWDVLREPEIVAGLVSSFGEGIVGGDGAIDRSALGAIVFRDPLALARLNATVQPRLLARVREALALPAAGPIILDAAMLTTWGLEPELDGVVEIVAPEPARIDRLRRARGYATDEAKARVQGQRLPPPRNSKRHWIIQNDGDLAAFRRGAESVWLDIAAIV